MKPVELSEATLQSISDNSASHLATYREAYAHMFAIRLGPDNYESGGMDLTSAGSQGKELPANPKTLVLRKTARCYGHVYLLAMLTASRFRPLARRLLITRRPFFVDMRTRNPWVLFREVLLGLNVLFILFKLLYVQVYCF